MQDTGAPTDYLVVVGASAGGIEALIEMVSGLPADFQAPMVITQHLDPRRPSHLAEILAQRGRLAVRVVEGREPLRPGVIYLVPADRQVEIADHEVRLCDPSGSGPRPSVDVLFRGAAGAYGEQLIAVVLTGSDADAAAGAAVVKAAGGMVIIQNTSAARYPTMPASLAPAVVDVVADLERIGPLLYDLVRGAYLPSQPGDEVSLRDFLEGMRLQSGLDFTSYPMPAIRRRLQRRMAAVQTGQLTEYVRYVADDPEEYQRLINSFLIQLTEFFHDPELYAYLREQVLPELIAGAERRGRDLRLWWAGCATGQEAYSL
ncbi:MAG TPA: chemotaxis protein CheB, partial [Chloroflexota bacterium]|nr:chemotaxis protein CheB [Chloroflexota bacterium]